MDGLRVSKLYNFQLYTLFNENKKTREAIIDAKYLWVASKVVAGCIDGCRMTTVVYVQ